METPKMLPPIAALVAAFIACSPLTTTKADAAENFVFLRDCTSGNLDAVTANKSANTAAADAGHACIQYIKTFLQGFEAGSLVAENYLTAYLSNQAAKIYPAETDYKQALMPMQQAIVSATKKTPYNLCIPKGTSDTQVARVVVDSLEAEKPELRRYERPEVAITSALTEKYQNPDLSCKAESAN